MVELSIENYEQRRKAYQLITQRRNNKVLPNIRCHAN